jgi:hypothetical protein
VGVDETAESAIGGMWARVVGDELRVLLGDGVDGGGGAPAACLTTPAAVAAAGVVPVGGDDDVAVVLAAVFVCAAPISTLIGRTPSEPLRAG